MASLINITEMETRLRANGVTVADLCKEAGIDQSTWGRWKRDVTQPNLKTWGRVVAAYQKLLKPEGAGTIGTSRLMDEIAGLRNE